MSYLRVYNLCINVSINKYVVLTNYDTSSTRSSKCRNHLIPKIHLPS